MIGIPHAVQNQMLKPVIISYNWMEYAGRQEDQAVSEAFKKVNIFFKWLDIPRRVVKLSHFKGGLFERGVRVTKTSSGLLAIFGATLKSLHEGNWLCLSQRHLSIISGVGFVGSVSLIFKSLYDIRAICSKSLESIKIFSLCLKISKLVLGILGALVFLLEWEIKFLILIFSTSRLIFRNYKNFLYY